MSFFSEAIITVRDEQITYRVNSWVPEPRQAANRDLCLGYLNTSP